MRITAIAENTSLTDGIGAEHGLSLYIETECHKILFDMGQTDLFAKNADALGIDLSLVDVAVLSHGHYDHGGGIKKFLEINSESVIYANKNVFLPHYNAAGKYIGLDIALKDEKRLVFVDDEFNITEGIRLYSRNGDDRPNSFGCFGLTESVDGELRDDSFFHEQYMTVEENGKKVLFSGCSHKGILDIVTWFSPDVLVGGFHFSKLPLGKTLDDAAKILDLYKTRYYTCHCTGVEQYEYMRSKMKNLRYIHCGETVII